MQKQLRDKWVEALRSGKYEQGREQLRDDNEGFCCIGVLCDVYDHKGWGRDLSGYNFDGETGSLTMSLNQRLGLSIVTETYLIRMNDKDEKTFPEIADYIEANVPVE